MNQYRGFFKKPDEIECELCDFEPSTQNKYRERRDHLVREHFYDKIDKILPQCKPYNCPQNDCVFVGKDKQDVMRHFTCIHDILKKCLNEALGIIDQNQTEVENSISDNSLSSPLNLLPNPQNEPQQTLHQSSQGTSKSSLPILPQPPQKSASNEPQKNFQRSPARPFNCSKCGRGFFEEPNLQMHQKWICSYEPKKVQKQDEPEDIVKNQEK